MINKLKEFNTKFESLRFISAKNLLMILFVGIFIYQFYILSMIYLSFPTSLEVKINNIYRQNSTINIEELPAISFCRNDINLVNNTHYQYSLLGEIKTNHLSSMGNKSDTECKIISKNCNDIQFDGWNALYFLIELNAINFQR